MGGGGGRHGVGVGGDRQGRGRATTGGDDVVGRSASGLRTGRGRSGSDVCVCVR